MFITARQAAGYVRHSRNRHACITQLRKFTFSCSMSFEASTPGDGSGPQRLKLLCLHGYLQNAELFKTRIGSMRKALKSRADLIFVDGPFEATGFGEGEAAEAGAGGRSWWQWTDIGPAGRPSHAAMYTGWEVSLDILVAAIRKHQPDGLLGFSQGATAVALLLASLQNDAEGSGKLLGYVPPPKFAVMVAGFCPRDARYAEQLQRACISTPALFVHGEMDMLVPPIRTMELVNTFKAGSFTVYCHGGAHLVPTCSGNFKAALIAFLDKHRAAEVAGSSVEAEMVSSGTRMVVN